MCGDVVFVWNRDHQEIKPIRRNWHQHQDSACEGEDFFTFGTVVINAVTSWGTAVKSALRESTSSLLSFSPISTSSCQLPPVTHYHTISYQNTVFYPLSITVANIKRFLTLGYPSVSFVSIIWSIGPFDIWRKSPVFAHCRSSGGESGIPAVGRALEYGLKYDIRLWEVDKTLLGFKVENCWTFRWTRSSASTQLGRFVTLGDLWPTSLSNTLLWEDYSVGFVSFDRAFE